MTLEPTRTYARVMGVGGRIVLGVLVLVAAPAAIEARDYTITRIADGTNLPSVFPANSADRASINRGGTVAFFALDSIYVGDGSNLMTAVRNSLADPASQFSSIGPPSINDSGELGFNCYPDPAGQVVMTYGLEGVCSFAPGGPVVVVAGQHGTDPAQPFGGAFSLHPDIDPSGAVFFTGSLGGGSGIGRGAGGPPTVLLDSNASSLVGSISQIIDEPVVNAHGDVAFGATLDSGDPAIVLLQHDGTLVVLATGTASYFYGLSINDAGVVAYTETYPSGRTRVLATADGVNVTVISDSAANGIAPGNYPPSINAAGQVVFAANGAAGPLWVGDGTTLEPVNASGIQVVGSVAARSLNDSGQIAFIGEGGVYRADPLSQLSLTNTDHDHRWGDDPLVPFDITVSNQGGLAQGVVLHERVPAATTFSDAGSTPGWSCAPGPEEGSDCTFTAGDLATGASRKATFATTVAEGTDPLFIIFNEASTAAHPSAALTVAADRTSAPATSAGWRARASLSADLIDAIVYVAHSDIQYDGVQSCIAATIDLLSCGFSYPAGVCSCHIVAGDTLDECLEHCNYVTYCSCLPQRGSDCIIRCGFNPVACSSSSAVSVPRPELVRSASASPNLIDLALLYRVRDRVFRATPGGRRVTNLYYTYTRALLDAGAAKPPILDLALTNLLAWEPSLQALVDGTGATVTVTAEEIQGLNAVLDAVRPAASPDLRQAIDRERALANLPSWVGLPIDQALARLDQLSCEPAATFPSASCRFDELVRLVHALVPKGALSRRLATAASKGKGQVARAETKTTQGKTRPARSALAKAIRTCVGFEKRLASRPARALSADTRGLLGAESSALQTDLGTLRGT